MPLSPKLFISIRVAATALLLLLSPRLSAKPNILLVITDDQGYGDASCYWPQTDLQTPIMDRIASEGVRFDRFRVNPLCAPTRASIMTGVYSIYNGMWRGPSAPKNDSDGKVIKPDTRVVGDDFVFLPTLLQQAGYRTGLFGKWHLGYDEDNTPDARGFDQYLGFLSGAHPYRMTPNSKILRDGEPIQSEKHLTDLFADEAIQFIEKNKDQPFFCYLAFNAVHGPLRNAQRSSDSGRQDWLDRYKEAGVDQPRRDYCAVMSHADDRVGDVLDALDSLGIAKDTFVIYLSDNGGIIDKYPSDNGPLRSGKGYAFEGGIRVPAVMKWPGHIEGGFVSAANAVHFDLFATLLDAAGIATPSTNGDYAVEAVSLLPHLKSKGDQPYPERYLFWDLWGKQAAAKGDWKIVGELSNHHGDFAKATKEASGFQYALYNLEHDIGETNDLSKSHPEIYNDLKQRLVAWLRQANSP